MILVDTGFFLALAQPRDQLHGQASLWSKATAGPFLVTHHILWETVNGLSDPADRLKAHLLLEEIRTSAGYEIIPATSDLLEVGLRLHADRPDKAWSLTDCISFVVMEEHGIRQALTYDHHFEQAGFEALLRRDP